MITMNEPKTASLEKKKRSWTLVIVLIIAATLTPSTMMAFNLFWHKNYGPSNQMKKGFEGMLRRVGNRLKLEYDVKDVGTYQEIVTSYAPKEENGFPSEKQSEVTRKLLDEDVMSAVQARKYYWTTTSNLGVHNVLAAIGNPLKGLTPNAQWYRPPFNHLMKNNTSLLPHSLEFYYVGLDTVMTGPNKFNWTTFERLLNESSRRNTHVIPRFFVHYPNLPQLRVPSYLIEAGIKLVKISINNGTSFEFSPDYNDIRLQKAFREFIVAFGKRYDGDHRIGYIQMGLLGFWGEWHCFGYPSLIPVSLKTSVIQWYTNAFKITHVQTRFPISIPPTSIKLNNTTILVTPKFGYHDDSFTHSTLYVPKSNSSTSNKFSWFFWNNIQSKNLSNFWKYAPMGGETRPEYQKSTFLNSHYPTIRSYKNTTLSPPQSFAICARTTHATYMHHNHIFNPVIDTTSVLGREVLSNARLAHASMGYNFQVKEVMAVVNIGNTVDIDVVVEQVGVAPFYYDLSIVLKCQDIAAPIVVPGVQSLIEKFQSKTFKFQNLPSTLACLQSVSLSLQSSMTRNKNQTIKFAQGIDGAFVRVPPIPLPPPPLQ